MAFTYDNININSKTIWYRHLENKGKPPLIFIPGWPLPGSDHTKALDAATLALREAGFEVYTPDLPGLMMSDPIPKNWKLEDYVDFVEDFRKALKLDRFIVIGQSFGGRVAVLYTLKYQRNGHIKNLILINASTFSKDQLGWLQNILQDLFLAANKSVRFLLLLPIAPRIIKEFLIRNFTGYPRNVPFEGESKKRANTLNFFITFRDRHARYPFSDIKVPTLILWGTQDISLQLSLAEYLNQEIKDSKLIPFKGSHTSIYTNPKIIIEILKGNI